MFNLAYNRGTLLLRFFLDSSGKHGKLILIFKHSQTELSLVPVCVHACVHMGMRVHMQVCAHEGIGQRSASGALTQGLS